MAEYARNFFIAIFLGCLLLGLFIVGTSSPNTEGIYLNDEPMSVLSTSPLLEKLEKG